MTISALTPQNSLNKAFRKVKPNRTDIERFKTNLIQLLDHSNDSESEEFHKNLVSDFLKKTWYEPRHFINTKGRNDMVIHNGDNAKSTVGVILEAKKPTNKSEMPTSSRLNTKAFQELVLYYLRERINGKNLEVKRLIITNIYEWYIFDSVTFDRLFAQNKNLVKQFQDFEEKRLADTKTDFFYKQIAEPFVAAVETEVEYTYFNLNDYLVPLRNADKSDDKILIALYKVLSPEHLLKLPFANDSNSLDRRFYGELLHIIGLTEYKDGGKKLIDRHKVGERHSGSILEDTIIQLDSLDKINRLSQPLQFGATHADRLFNVALELSITWINRILFLKLLEGQLVSYHKGDRSYTFLHSDKLREYDDLNGLFFQVLAKRNEERNSDVRTDFAKVPYLNSSLFEPTELEHQTIFISNLKDDKSIPLHRQTVLKDKQGKTETGTMRTLEYLFRFLDAYDFSSEGAEDIQEDNKALINASVLGLIFEKINGYKDGSFFTPGFITMYMCRETIRRAVVQKFNETKGWNCTNLDELYDKIEDRTEANRIANSVHICDPAVGSGHFLVSALNEMIALKSDLRILQDRDGRRLKEYSVEVVNDELIVTDGIGGFFEYIPSNREAQRIQETLFHEKQTIIENCLFGVDINPNSVKICRLRLWIELLKNAYYKSTDVLETLPNIDINIKCGNSLVSRFALDADLKKALKSLKYDISTYRSYVREYHQATNKDVKRGLNDLINQIKSDFRTEIGRNDPMRKRLDKLASELYHRFTGNFLFEPEVPYGENQGDLDKKRATEKDKLEKEIEKITAEMEAVKANRMYENAFEWRFEFPEVLNDEGDFVGFDVVMGNPPYMRIREASDFTRSHYIENYYVSENQLDLYHLFVERAFYISKPKSIHTLVVPNAFLANQNTVKLRKFILDNFSIEKIVEVKGSVFEEASVEVLIYLFEKKKSLSMSEYHIAQNGTIKFINKFDSTLFIKNQGYNFTVTIDTLNQKIVDKILNISVPLQTYFDSVTGIKEYQVGKGKPPQTEQQVKEKKFNSTNRIDDTYLPELRGKNLQKYFYNWESEHISYGIWLAEPREFSFFLGEKILVRQIPSKTTLVASWVNDTFIVDQTAYILKPKPDINSKFYLGILNSRLLFWYFQNINNEFDSLFPKIKIKELNTLPIPKIDFTHKPIETLVNQILATKQADPAADTTALEREINVLVYGLYGLSAEEVAIVEGEKK